MSNTREPITVLSYLHCLLYNAYTELYLLTWSLCHDYYTGTSDAIARNSLICASVGQEVTLACFLFPPMSAEDMQVTWTQGEDEEFIVHFYRNGTESEEKQKTQFRGRTRMTRKDITSGQVALTIRNVTIADAGQYFCAFTSNTVPWKTSDGLKVTVTG